MDLEFDPAKDRLNRQQRGLGFDLVRELDWDRTKLTEDRRYDYGEVRLIGVGPIRSKLHVVVFTLRRGTVRVISLRRANKREERAYGRA